MTTEAYCRDKAAPPGSNLYYSILFHPPELKRGLHALFAFAHEVHHTVLNHSDPGVARLKLQWWHNEIDNIYNEQSRHPIGIELHSLQRSQALDKALFHQYIDAAERFLDPVQPEDFAAWQLQHAGWAGPLWQLATGICPYQNAESARQTVMIGSLVSMLDTLQTLPLYYSKGYCVLPRQEMQTHGVAPETLHANNEAPTLQPFFTELVARIRMELDKACTTLPVEDRRPLLFCLINAQLAAALCRQIEKDYYRLLQNRLGLTPLRKLWIAWRQLRTKN